MYTARNTGTGEDLRFRSLDALVRRLGGNTWNTLHSPHQDPPQREIEVYREDKQGKHVLARLLVPTEAVNEFAKALAD